MERVVYMARKCGRDTRQTEEARQEKRTCSPKGTSRECGWNRCNLVVRRHGRPAKGGGVGESSVRHCWCGPIWDAVVGYVVQRRQTYVYTCRERDRKGRRALASPLLLNATLARPCGMSLASIVSRRWRRHTRALRLPPSDPADVRHDHFGEIVSALRVFPGEAATSSSFSAPVADATGR
ncbi:hypothetical protein MRX96_019071 [Rhipicephalus microplus]